MMGKLAQGQGKEAGGIMALGERRQGRFIGALEGRSEFTYNLFMDMFQNGGSTFGFVPALRTFLLDVVPSEVLVRELMSNLSDSRATAQGSVKEKKLTG